MARRANIHNGVWTRQILPSGQVGRTRGRTCVPERVLRDPTVTTAQIVFWDGPKLTMPMANLSRALAEAPLRRAARGPVNFDWLRRTVHGQPVPMTVTGAGRPATPGPEEPQRKAWSSGETAWHRETTARIAADPGLVIPDAAADPVVRVWHNSVFAGDGARLWNGLRTGKRPDVTVEQASGGLTPIEVEPDGTAAVGAVQAGDYVLALQVDARLGGAARVVRGGILVVQSAAGRLLHDLGDLLEQRGVRVVNLP